MCIEFSSSSFSFFDKGISGNELRCWSTSFSVVLKDASAFSLDKFTRFVTALSKLVTISLTVSLFKAMKSSSFSEISASSQSFIRLPSAWCTCCVAVIYYKISHNFQFITLFTYLKLWHCYECYSTFVLSMQNAHSLWSLKRLFHCLTTFRVYFWQ